MSDFKPEDAIITLEIGNEKYPLPLRDASTVSITHTKEEESPWQTLFRDTLIRENNS